MENDIPVNKPKTCKHKKKYNILTKTGKLFKKGHHSTSLTQKLCKGCKEGNYGLKNKK